MLKPWGTEYLLFHVEEDSGPHEACLSIQVIGNSKETEADIEEVLFQPLRKKGVTTYVKHDDSGKPIEFLVPFTQTMSDARRQMQHKLKKSIHLCFAE